MSLLSPLSLAPLAQLAPLVCSSVVSGVAGVEMWLRSQLAVRCLLLGLELRDVDGWGWRRAVRIPTDGAWCGYRSLRRSWRVIVWVSGGWCIGVAWSGCGL